MIHVGCLRDAAFERSSSGANAKARIGSIELVLATLLYAARLQLCNVMLRYAVEFVVGYYLAIVLLRQSFLGGRASLCPPCV